MIAPTPDLSCRRRNGRIPLPVEVRITLHGQTIKATIRDASLDDDPVDGIGIGLLHDEVLPVGELLRCQVTCGSELLGREFEFVLFWTRCFGGDGCLSGGRIMVPADPSLEQSEGTAGGHRFFNAQRT